MKNLNLVLFSLFCLIQPAFASESITSNIKHALKHTAHSNYFSVVIALGVVIMLIYITALIYAKLDAANTKAIKKQYGDISDSKLIILSNTPIGNNKSLLVVELAGKKMLIGVTNESINLIKDMNENSNINADIPKDVLFDKMTTEKTKKEENIEIVNKIPEEDETSQNESEDFGLYKKYLE